MRFLIFFLTLISSLQASPKLLVLIIASDEEPIYVEDQKIWRSYMHNDPEHVTAYFIKCKSDLKQAVKVEGDTIWVQGEEGIKPGIINKTLSALELMLPQIQQEFDYVLRSNLSSFFVFPKLLEFLEGCPKERFYGSGGGTGHYGHTTHEWAHGCGYFLSKDVAELLVKHKTDLYDRIDENDDVLVGKFLIQEQKIPLSLTPRVDLLSSVDWQRARPHLPGNDFHFRVKHMTYADQRMEEDLFIYSQLLELYYPKEPLHLVWVDYPPEQIWCSEWLLGLFPHFDVSHVTDLGKTHFEDHVLIVVSKTDSLTNQRFLEEYQRRGLRYGLIHLGDEVYQHPTDIYKGADFVFREYWHKKFNGADDVICIPAGHKTSTFAGCKGKETSVFERQYLWSFAGELQKTTRPFMAASLIKMQPYALRQGLSDEEYKNLMVNTIFAPCPRGWWNLDSFRLLESLEAGCIPIVEKSPVDYFPGLFGNHPFLAVNSWAEAPQLIAELIQNPAELETRRLECYTFLQDYKQQLQQRAESLIHSKWSKKELPSF